jgi:hypothetical protein
MGNARKQSAIEQYAVVRVVRLDQDNRPFTGTPSVCRSPQIGDIGTVVHVYDLEDSTSAVVVEAVATDGCTVWLADFFPHDLELEAGTSPGDSSV